MPTTDDVLDAYVLGSGVQEENLRESVKDLRDQVERLKDLLELCLARLEATPPKSGESDEELATLIRVELDIDEDE